MFYLSQKDFGSATSLLREALTESDDARLHNDLGVAEFEQGKNEYNEDHPGDSFLLIARSVEEFKAAIKKDKTLQEAQFNLALCHQQMKLFLQAEKDWTQYLALDSSSRWAEEARKNLSLVQEEQKRVAESSSQSFPKFLEAVDRGDRDAAFSLLTESDRNGSSIAEKLIDNYLKNTLDERDGDAKAVFTTLDFAGQTELSRLNDHYISDVVIFLRSASTEKIKSIANARNLMHSANALYLSGDCKQAIDLYTKAQSIFDGENDISEGMLVRYWIGVCYLRGREIPQALLAFTNLTQSLDNRKYRLLLAKTFNSVKDAQISRHEYASVIRTARTALSLSKQTNDVDNELSNYGLIGGLDYILGNQRESLDFGLAGLKIAAENRFPPVQMYPFYSQISMNLNEIGAYECAYDFQREALKLGTEAGSPIQMARSYKYLAIIEAKLGRFEEAINEGHNALDVVEKMSDPPRTSERGTALDVICSLHRQKGDYQSAIACSDESIKLFEKSNFPTYLYEAHKGKLLAYIAEKDDALAADELKITLNLFEANRDRIDDDTSRNSFIDTDNVYDIAIDFAYTRLHNGRQALEYAESSHARSLLDSIDSPPTVNIRDNQPILEIQSHTTPLSIEQISSQLRGQVQLIQYALLKDKIIIWIIGDETHPKEVKIDYKDLADRIEQFLNLLRDPASDQASLKQLGENLYRILFEPIGPFLNKGTQVYIIPDKILNYLPFNALVSPESGRYLLQDYTLGVTPSASVFTKLSTFAAEKSAKSNETILSVGSPSFDHELYSNLGDLGSSSKEAKVIASLYNGSALVGDYAAKKEILSRLGDVSVVHFATHAITDDRSPLLSKLLLAKSADGKAEDTALYSYELYAASMPHVRLVVLSACQSGIEHYYQGEGMIGLARPFMSQKIPLVVASLWAVDSQSTKQLMMDFHDFRKRGLYSTVESIRQSQLKMLVSNSQELRHPYYWAPFTTLGGYARY
ncbi:MAG TPA: CHAT domain-containing tetratricopeptide repeat protein [Blastocatellia bacterium]|nr:CHAT domain-containing tetratricopeptide repeat protein [Blastocatellia bacterium]